VVGDEQDRSAAERDSGRRTRGGGAVTSRYGKSFDQQADEWARLETEHDRMHPDRGQCGGVGGCPMMCAAVEIEHTMIELLDQWRMGLTS
jgi:hypothetical protein